MAICAEQQEAVRETCAMTTAKPDGAAWTRRAVALAAWLAAGPASAYVSFGGMVDPQPPFGETQFPGTVFRVGHLTPGAFGNVVVTEGSQLTAGGIRAHGGGLLVNDSGSFLDLAGADRSVWAGWGNSGYINVHSGGQIRASGGCSVGQCDLLIGGTTGQPFNYALGTSYPISIDNGAKGDLVLWGSKSRITMDGTLRVAHAHVGSGSSAPQGLGGGGAAGVVNVHSGGVLSTGNALLAIGPSGPGRDGTEQAAAYVNVHGAGSRWNIVRNPTSGAQATLTLGVRGDQGAGGTQLTANVGVYDGAMLFLDGRSGGANPGIILANAGTTSHGLLQVGGAGASVQLAGDTGFINLGGSAGSAGGWGGLFIAGGAQVQGVDDALVFVNVGRNGVGAFGELRVDGTAADGTRSQLSLSGRGGPLGGSAGQSAFLSVGRGGASGLISVTNGGRIYIGTAAYQDGLTTTSAGFAIARDAGSFGEIGIHGAGSEVFIASGDLRPFAAIGQAGPGKVSMSGGAKLQMISGNPLAPGNNLLYVGGGGSAAASGDGLLDMSGASTQLFQGNLDDNLLIAGSGPAGARGRLQLREGANLTTTRLVLGQGAGGEGVMALDSGATVTLRGSMRQSPTTGANLVIGHGGGSGDLQITGAGSRLAIDSEGSFAGLIAGGSGSQPGGSALLRLSDGGLIEVLDRDRVDHGMVLGRNGSAGLQVYDAALKVHGAGRMIVAAAPGSNAQVIAGNALLEAGRLLLVGGNETPDAAGSGLVHADGWAPVALNQSPGAGTGADGYLHLERGTRLNAKHVGLALQAGSRGGIGLFSGARLQVDDTMMVGALSHGFVNVDGSEIQLTSPQGRLTLGGFAGSKGNMAVRAGSRVFHVGSQSTAVIGDAGSGHLLIENGGQFDVATMLVGAAAGGRGRVDVQGGGALHVGTPSTVPLWGLALGGGAGSVGELHVNGDGSRISVVGANPVPVRVGVGGQGLLALSGGATLRVDNRAAAGTMTAGLHVGGSSDSLFSVAQDSQIEFAGRGNFVNVSAGRALMGGQIDLTLTGRPDATGSLGSLAPGSSFASLPGPKGTRLITLQYDGYTPQAGDLLPLFSAREIGLGTDPGLSTYRLTTMDGAPGGRPAYEFGLGSGNALFRVEVPRAGLYPTLERTKRDGNDALGLRFIEQAVFIDWDTPSAAGLEWRLDSRDNLLYAHIEYGIEGSVGHGLVEDERANLLRGVLNALWSGKPAATGAGAPPGLGNQVALPVFESSTTALKDLSHALVVRFADPYQRPEGCGAGCPSQSFAGIDLTMSENGSLPLDLRNRNKGGEVLVFADDLTYGIDPHGTVHTLLHEVGHGLGLLHTWDRAKGQVMDYSERSLLFNDGPMQVVEPPEADGYGYDHSQNAMFHLLRYTFGWSEAELSAFGAVPGSLDDGRGDPARFFGQMTLYDELEGFYNVTVLLPALNQLGEIEWSIAARLSGDQRSFAALLGSPLRILASSTPGGDWDVYFETEPGSGVTGRAGEALTAGVVVRFDPVSSQSWTVGEYTLATAPVPEPSSALTLLAGGLALWGWRRLGNARRSAVGKSIGVLTVLSNAQVSPEDRAAAA
jgi:T5SS/PEP-CTERM-associated repeat protein